MDTVWCHQRGGCAGGGAYAGDCRHGAGFGPGWRGPRSVASVVPVDPTPGVDPPFGPGPHRACSVIQRYHQHSCRYSHQPVETGGLTDHRSAERPAKALVARAADSFTQLGTVAATVGRFVFLTSLLPRALARGVARSA